jgi:hypothetical protein
LRKNPGQAGSEWSIMAYIPLYNLGGAYYGECFGTAEEHRQWSTPRQDLTACYRYLGYTTGIKGLCLKNDDEEAN